MTRAADSREENRSRRRVEVQGAVQGVGFRPFVFGLATRLGLSGFVGNESRGVFVEIEGSPETLDEFVREISASAPPLAVVDRVEVAEMAPVYDTGFTIVASAATPGANTLVSPDVGMCDDCFAELFDPGNRRFRYPFTNCTNCGPRFTIVRDIPYDRPLTTMAGFTMCDDCQREYDDPLDRRFHAQPNACPLCGPQVAFQRRGEPDVWFREDAMERAQRTLVAGEIVAVKGIGGFHLACDAASDPALERLRVRKGRVDKPFAVMARDLDTARRIAEIDERERRLLESRERPVVLLRKRAGGPLSSHVAPGNDYVGVMLPYTPLHHVLLRGDDGSDALDLLVMTSGNYSGEPIVTDDLEALDALAPLVDAFLLHDRPIHVHCDDSVVRVFEGRELPVRRSRGYAPMPVRLPFALPPTFAVGGEIKSTFCVARDDYAFMSQHIGDLENLETLAALDRSVVHLASLFRVAPEIVAADMHPRYLASRWARENVARVATEGARLVLVQHHHAHVAGVMAEHGLDRDARAIGVVFDGTGYGTDGAIWGGEVLLAHYHAFERAAHLRYVPLPGGDASIRRPYRAALAHLWSTGIAWDEAIPAVATCSDVERRVLRRQLETGLNCASTSSFGRLFDAVAAIAGVRQTVTYEAQAAIEFEALADRTEPGAYAFGLTDDLEIDPRPVLEALVGDIRSRIPTSRIAMRFHRGVADVINRLAAVLRERTGIERVALTGGVFQNVLLLELVSHELRAAGFQVLTNRLVPPNDGGLALGQAVAAAAMCARDQRSEEPCA